MVLILYSVKTGDFVWLSDDALPQMLDVNSDFTAPHGPSNVGAYTHLDIRSRLVDTVSRTATNSVHFHTRPVSGYVQSDPQDCRNAIAVAAIIAARYRKSLMSDILATLTAYIPSTAGINLPTVVTNF